MVLDWLVDHLALIMFVAMFFVIFCGYPVAFVMGGMALIFGFIGWTLGVFNMIGLYDIVLRMWGGVAADPVLASIPMFIFMGSILERSGSAADMLKATEVLLKRLPGSLAVAVMVMGTILAAPIGTVGAAVVTLSVIALPQMLQSGYDKRLAIGTIASAGTLGILIPPAIMLVVMAEMLVTSAGALFLAATMPGFVPHVTCGSSFDTSMRTVLSNSAPCSVASERHSCTSVSISASFGPSSRPRRYANVVSSGEIMPARAPASIDMLQTVMRSSIESARIASPVYSTTWPPPPDTPI